MHLAQLFKFKNFHVIDRSARFGINGYIQERSFEHFWLESSAYIATYIIVLLLNICAVQLGGRRNLEIQFKHIPAFSVKAGFVVNEAMTINYSMSYLVAMKEAHCPPPLTPRFQCCIMKLVSSDVGKLFIFNIESGGRGLKCLEFKFTHSIPEAQQIRFPPCARCLAELITMGIEFD